MTLRGSALALYLFLPVAAYATPASLTNELVQGGASRVVAQRIQRHVALGLPSSASRKNDNDYLLPRNGYVISYNASRNALNWAGWSLTKADLGDAPRSDAFRPDATLPARFYKPTSADYKIPGFSRGHMVRSGERTASVRENRKTYVFSNMLPQAVNNNAGPWNMFEDFYRDEVKNSGKVAHLYAGGIFGATTVQKRGVDVPSATWKIVALTPEGEAASVIDEHTRVVAIIIPNNNDTVKVEQDWGRYRVSVAEIEKQTGLTFFSELPPALAKVLKSRVDTGPVPPPAPHDWEPHNWSDNGASRLQKIVSTQVSGKVKFYDTDKKYGFVTLADGSDVYVSSANRVTSIRTGEPVTLDVALNTSGKTFAMKVKSLDPKATPVADEKWVAPAGGSAPPKVDKVVATKVSGTVKFYDAKKGFGFIETPDGKSVFVHATNRATDIKDGDPVTFDLAEQGDGRMKALAVRSTDPKAGPPTDGRNRTEGVPATTN